MVMRETSKIKEKRKGKEERITRGNQRATRRQWSKCHVQRVALPASCSCQSEGKNRGHRSTAQRAGIRRAASRAEDSALMMHRMDQLLTSLPAPACANHHSSLSAPHCIITLHYLLLSHLTPCFRALTRKATPTSALHHLHLQLMPTLQAMHHSPMAPLELQSLRKALPSVLASFPLPLQSAMLIR